MKTIKLKILAEDILNTNYHYDHDCAITRALKRAGKKLTDNDLSNLVGGSTETNESYRQLVEKVMGMYGTKDGKHYIYGMSKNITAPFLPIQDFEHTITF